MASKYNILTIIFYVIIVLLGQSIIVWSQSSPTKLAEDQNKELLNSLNQTNHDIEVATKKIEVSSSTVNKALEKFTDILGEINKNSGKFEMFLIGLTVILPIFFFLIFNKITNTNENLTTLDKTQSQGFDSLTKTMNKGFSSLRDAILSSSDGGRPWDRPFTAFDNFPYSDRTRKVAKGIVKDIKLSERTTLESEE